MRVAVVGHVEWVDFLRVDRVLRQGEIVSASEAWQAAAGGGADAAVQLLKLAGSATLFTALGDDEYGRQAFAELTDRGLRVEAAWRAAPRVEPSAFSTRMKRSISSSAKLVWAWTTAVDELPADGNLRLRRRRRRARARSAACSLPAASCRRRRRLDVLV
jgi:hypothetical protein